MIQKMIFACYLLGFVQFSYSQENTFSQKISHLWYESKKQEVYRIAEQRLQQDSNDIAGLFLKLEYESEFLEFDKMRITLEKLLPIAQQVQEPEFKKYFPMLENIHSNLDNIVAHYTPETLAADRAKARLDKKRMGYILFIEILEKNGLINNLSNEKELLQTIQNNSQTNPSTTSTPSEIQSQSNQSQPSLHSLNKQEAPIPSNRNYWVIGLVLLSVLGCLGYFFIRKKS